MSSEGLAIPLSSPGRVTETLLLRTGEPLLYRSEDWHGALIVVQGGTLQIECQSGRTAAFERGSVVHLQDLPLATLRAAEGEDVSLLVLRPIRN